jgi:hypothetical protein
MSWLIGKVKAAELEAHSFISKHIELIEELKKEIFRVVKRNSCFFLITLNGDGLNSKMLFKVTAMDSNFSEIAINDITDPDILKEYAELVLNLNSNILPEKNEIVTQTCIRILSERFIEG